jgi:hypothetical protein
MNCCVEVDEQWQLPLIQWCSNYKLPMLHLEDELTNDDYHFRNEAIILAEIEKLVKLAVLLSIWSHI